MPANVDSTKTTTRSLTGHRKRIATRVLGTLTFVLIGMACLNGCGSKQKENLECESDCLSTYVEGLGETEPVALECLATCEGRHDFACIADCEEPSRNQTEEFGQCNNGCPCLTDLDDCLRECGDFEVKCISRCSDRYAKCAGEDSPYFCARDCEAEDSSCIVNCEVSTSSSDEFVDCRTQCSATHLDCLDDCR